MERTKQATQLIDKGFTSFTTADGVAVDIDKVAPNLYKVEHQTAGMQWRELLGFYRLGQAVNMAQTLTTQGR